MTYVALTCSSSRPRPPTAVFRPPPSDKARRIDLDLIAELVAEGIEAEPPRAACRQILGSRFLADGGFPLQVARGMSHRASLPLVFAVVFDRNGARGS